MISIVIIRSFVLLVAVVLLFAVVFFSWLKGEKGTLHKALQRRLWNSEDK